MWKVFGLSEWRVLSGGGYRPWGAERGGSWVGGDRTGLLGTGEGDCKVYRQRLVAAKADAEGAWGRAQGVLRLRISPVTRYQGKSGWGFVCRMVLCEFPCCNFLFF